jgi:hypothetical protein
MNLSASAKRHNFSRGSPRGGAKSASEAKDGKVLFTAKLPEEEGYQVVVLFLPSPNAEKNFRIELQSHICGSPPCANLEYASPLKSRSPQKPFRF